MAQKDKKDIMTFEQTLPADFDGVFRFTNWTEEDFVGVWGGKEYHFPAETTSPMIMHEYSPLEIQHIRKKFAKDLAEREFFNSKGFKSMLKQERNPDGSARLNSIHSAGSYSLNELTPFIQRCLEPLTVAKALVKEAQKDKLEDRLTRNEDGELNTEAIDRKTSLRDKALKA